MPRAWPRAMSIRDKPNRTLLAVIERVCRTLDWVLSPRVLDHTIVLGEAHLRRLLISSASYQNEIRTHRALQKDAPTYRPNERIGILKSHSGRNHHQYVRI